MSRPPWTPAWTGIGRPLDLRYRSNRFVVLAAALAGLGTLAWQWRNGLDAAVLWSIQVVVGVFLAWAIGRELDPDDSRSAGAAALVVLPLIALGPPSLGSGAAALVAVRIAVRTTGRSPQWIDGVGLIAAAGYLGTQLQAWPALAALILSTGADRVVEPRGPSRTLWFSVLMTVAALLGAMTLSTPSGWTQSTRAEWLILAVTFVAALFIVVNTRTPRSRGDNDDEVLSRSRLLALFTLAVGTVHAGGSAIAGLSPLWAATLAVAIVPAARQRARAIPG